MKFFWLSLGGVMSIAILFLWLTVVSAFVIKNHSVLKALCAFTVLIAYGEGLVDWRGLFSIALLALSVYSYFHSPIKNKVLKILSGAIMMVLLLAFFIHKAPGFHNILVIDKVSIDALSIPFSMYFNFDKVIAGLFLFIGSGLAASEKSIDIKSLQVSIKWLILCAAFLSGLGMMAGYVHWDVKVPYFFAVWAFNDFFFVCFSEEVLYREFVQNGLKTLTGKSYIAIFMASLVYGLAYLLKGNPLYALLAAIAGIFYGLTYDQTKRISCAMITHYGLNAVHFFLFTYPASISLLTS